MYVCKYCLYCMYVYWEGKCKDSASAHCGTVHARWSPLLLSACVVCHVWCWTMFNTMAYSAHVHSLTFVRTYTHSCIVYTLLCLHILYTLILYGAFSSDTHIHLCTHTWMHTTLPRVYTHTLVHAHMDAHYTAKSIHTHSHK